MEPFPKLKGFEHKVVKLNTENYDSIKGYYRRYENKVNESHSVDATLSRFSSEHTIEVTGESALRLKDKVIQFYYCGNSDGEDTALRELEEINELMEALERTREFIIFGMELAKSNEK